MGWKDLEFKERVSLATAGLQALATFGMFVVALIGIWQVAPIITYQVRQQESELAQLAVEPDTADPLVVDTLDWWTEQVRGYRQVVALSSESARQDRDVSFEIQRSAGTTIARGVRPDLLVVTATDSAGKTEVVSVAVNENALSPSQYLRLRVNQGAFAKLPADERRRVEIAVERYINRDMVPRVPPIIVRPDMSVAEMRAEVAMNEHHREEALRHIRGLQEVVAAAKRP